ncbi:hypothetical protein PILCRDRAFT_821453 [Piloderma croceum F 1598]|uniref:AMP-dependent synthetase/ligase domain-containing protein n=1 Tax=Piloderma croceum (strain F 1598) TaxID=765440 RepID=A0A0C3FQB5_PILCF|nr:hypothetical protein PILCRDRAFT_821453 [Piloderma croceum F 1598]
MSSPMIYTSQTPSVPIPTTSIFTLLFQADPSTAHIGRFPGSYPAFIDANTATTLSRATLRSLSLSLGYGLTQSTTHLGLHKLAKGDTIMIFSPNSLAWPIILFGSVAAGLRCTLANSAYTPRELQHQWTDSGAKVVFVHPSLVRVVMEMFKTGLGLGDDEARRRVVVSGSEWLTGVQDEGANPSDLGLIQLPSLLNQGTLRQEVLFNTKKEADESVYLCYSSGTTGKPKGVETTHKNICTIVNIVKPVFPPMTLGHDVFLGVLPFYHIYGAAKLLHFPLFLGTPVVIMPRFDPVAFCAHIEKYKVTVALIVPPMVLNLTRHPATMKYDLRSLKYLMSGAAPLGDALVNAFSNKLKSVGVDCRITQGYGLTETSPTTHLLPVQDWLRKVGSTGVLLPNLEARLIRDDTNSADAKNAEDAKPGESGELWIRGPSVMKGYLNNAKATKDAITPDGWFKTGDIAIRDPEGFYTIVDRKKELIKYKGFQVPPAELESVMLQHPDIADVAVIGIECKEEATELPRAYVVHANPASLKGDADNIEFGKSVQEWFKTKVARHKFLRGGVVVIDVIPKSAAGKILRRQLKDLAKKEQADIKTKL